MWSLHGDEHRCFVYLSFPLFLVSSALDEESLNALISSYIFISVSRNVESNSFGSEKKKKGKRQKERMKGEKKNATIGILLNLIEAWILFRIAFEVESNAI